MKIKFEMSTKKARALANSIIDTSRNVGIFDSRDNLRKFEHELRDTIRDFTNEDDFIINDFAGGTYRYGQNVASLYFDDDAAIDIAIGLIKLLAVIKPFFSVGKAMISTISGIRVSVTSTINKFIESFNKKYGNAPTYAATEVYSEDLGLYAYITVRNDGYDHWSIFRRTMLEDFVNSECMTNEELDKICLQLFTKYLQHDGDIDFYEMSEEDAIDDHNNYVNYYMEDKSSDTKDAAADTNTEEDDSDDIDADHDECDEAVDKFALVVIKSKEIMNDSRIYTAIVSPAGLVETKMIRGVLSIDAYHDRDVDEKSIFDYISARNRRGAYSYPYSSIDDIYDTISILTTQEKWYGTEDIDDRVQIEEISYTYVKNEEDK